MKNTKKLIGIAVLVAIIMFGVTSCSDGGSASLKSEELAIEETQGLLTIASLADEGEEVDLNGKYVIAIGNGLIAASSISKDEVFTGGKIKNDIVNLKVWNSNFSNFNGSGNKMLDVLVLVKPTINTDGFQELVDYESAIEELLADVDTAEDKKEDVYTALKDLVHGFMGKIAAVGSVTVNFTGGTASVAIDGLDILGNKYSDDELFGMVNDLF